MEKVSCKYIIIRLKLCKCRHIYQKNGCVRWRISMLMLILVLNSVMGTYCSARYVSVQKVSDLLALLREPFFVCIGSDVKNCIIAVHRHSRGKSLRPHCETEPRIIGNDFHLPLFISLSLVFFAPFCAVHRPLLPCSSLLFFPDL